ncbi:MAG: hypothetical protein RIG62_28435 [Cyclobacteriaceae bacterium]
MNTKTLFSVAAGMITGAWSARMIRRKQARHYMQDIERLITQRNEHIPSRFTYEQLEELPEPVQRYFRYVLPDGYPYISRIYLKHRGRFKTGPQQAWTPIAGEEYFTTDPPGFIWRGQTRLFTAYDQYITHRGQLLVRLFDLLKVVDTQGEHINQGELLRWLGESAWFPTNLLPSRYLRWSPHTTHSAKLSFDYHGLSVYYLVYFNEQGEITRLETERYMSHNCMESWVGELSQYQLWHGVRIPTVIKATWKLSEGDYTYAEFLLKDIIYYPAHHPQPEEAIPPVG